MPSEPLPPPPAASSETARRLLSTTRRTGTANELALRAALDALGVPYEVDAVPLPAQRRRRADLVIRHARVAVFSDGCFWHRCPQHFHPPKANADWWALKLRDVRRRDRDTDFRLRAAGWLPLRFLGARRPGDRGPPHRAGGGAQDGVTWQPGRSGAADGGATEPGVTVHDRPVHELLADCVRDLPAPCSEQDVLTWFARHHPQVEATTVSTHLALLSEGACPRTDLAQHEPLVRPVDLDLDEPTAHALAAAASPPAGGGDEAVRSRVEAAVAVLGDVGQAVSVPDLLSGVRADLGSPGLYSWWVDEAGAADLSEGLGHPLAPGLVYAGQAGATSSRSGRRSSNTLWARLARMHARGRARSSTFRRTLAAALTRPLGLDHEDDPRLDEWIDAHLSVVALPVTDPDTLARLEDDVLAGLDPPLNLQGRPRTPVRARLSELRRTGS